MSMWMGDAGSLLASVRAEMSPRQVADRQAERDERQAERDEAERRAAAEDRREQRLMGMQLAGVSARSHAEIVADAMRDGDEDAEYEEARKVMERIERRRAARLDQAHQRSELVAAVAQRSQRPMDPVEAALERARLAADDAAREGRRVVERARAQVRSRTLAAEPQIAEAPDGTVYYR